MTPTVKPSHVPGSSCFSCGHALVLRGDVVMCPDHGRQWWPWQRVQAPVTTVTTDKEK